MSASKFRTTARQKLAGKWGKAACISLAYYAFLLIVEFIIRIFEEVSFVNSILTIVFEIISIPLGFGLIYSWLKLYKDENTDAFDFLKMGFNNFGKAWGVSFQIFLKMLLPMLLTIVLTIIVSAIVVFFVINSFQGLYTDTPTYTATYSSTSVTLFLISTIVLLACIIWTAALSYYYQLSYFIKIENPEMTSKEAVEKSAKLMKGKRGKLFCLHFSFIGWTILSIFTVGIGYLWLMPYIQFATIAFYKALTENPDSIEVNIEDNNNPIQEI